MQRGRIRTVNERGFGFIRPEQGGADIFFHRSKLRGISFDRLHEGQLVEFDARQGPKGLEATQVKVLAAPPSVPGTTQSRDGQEVTPVKAAAPEGAGTEGAGTEYRFLNPYNFVRFLDPPAPGRTAEPCPGGVGAALQAAGVSPATGGRPAADLADQQLLGRCPPPPHDRYVGYSGRITCVLENVTPLFLSDSENIQQHGKHKSYEFFKLDGRPAIPGTSLRGVVRNVFEAVTNSCVPLLTDARLSYHLPAEKAPLLVPGRVEKNAAGFCLQLLTGSSELRVGSRPKGPQYAAWMLRYKPLRPSRNMPSSTPYGKRDPVALQGLGHQSRCWVVLERITHPRRNFEFWNVTAVAARRDQLPAAGAQQIQAEGYLCITNQNIENKHDERFFFHQAGLAKAATVPLSPEVVLAYKCLIQDYQQRHRDEVKKRHEAHKNPETPDGKDAGFSHFIVDDSAAKLQDGDLVYAMLQPGSNRQPEVSFIVPVSVPRVSYDRSTGQLLPDADRAPAEQYIAACSRYERLCPACRTFGWVHEVRDEDAADKERHVAYAGRVVFSHATLEPDCRPQTLPATPLAILSSPKPTTTRMYLARPDGSIPEKWDHDYGYDDGNVLRGRKFYRHHGTAREIDYARAGGHRDDQNRTVRDALAPGAKFRFTIDFENLAAVELGALLWALEMEGQGFQRLGYAKPLGFGSVKIQVTELALCDLAGRFQSLHESGWRPQSGWREEFVDVFQSAMAERYGKPFKTLENVIDLRAILTAHPQGLHVHYPRTGEEPDPKGKNFEWFMGNNRQQHLALPLPAQDQGLPLMDRNGELVP